VVATEKNIQGAHLQKITQIKVYVKQLFKKIMLIKGNEVTKFGKLATVQSMQPSSL